MAEKFASHFLRAWARYRGLDASAALLTAMIETAEAVGILEDEQAQILFSAATNPQNRQYGDMSDTVAAILGIWGRAKDDPTNDGPQAERPGSLSELPLLPAPQSFPEPH